MIQGFPCKIIDISTSEAGKHGHAKASIVAVDINTGKRYEDISPCSQPMVCPILNM